MIGLELYQRIASSLPPDLLLGEWFFADDVFGDQIPDPDDYLEKLLLRAIGPDSEMIEELTRARRLRSQYLGGCVERVVAASPTVVGFTTTFHQTCGMPGSCQTAEAAP